MRVVLGYQATALEIMTAAYLVCSLLTYGFAWGAPQNVEFPIVLEEVLVAEVKVKRVGSEGSDGSSPRLSREEVERAAPVLREHEPWGWFDCAADGFDVWGYSLFGVACTVSNED